MPAPYLRALIQRFWWRIALCALFVGLGVLAASYFLFPVYESTAYVQVVIHSTNSVYTADRIGHNEALLATSPGILKYAAERNAPLTATRLKSKVSVILEPNSHLIGITVQDNKAARAASVANDIAYALVVDEAENVQAANLAAQQPTLKLITSTQQQITQTQAQLSALGTPPSDPTKAAALHSQLNTLQTQLTQEQMALQQMRATQGATSILLVIAAKAQPAPAPLTTRIVEYTAAGIIGGGVLGFVLMLALDWLNWRVRSAAEVHTLLGADVLGQIDRGDITDDEGQVTEATYKSLLGAYQSLGRSLDFAGVDAPLRSLAVVSPERASASQALASGLAIYLAMSGSRTLLVDGYLATGRQARQFGLPSAPGLSDAALAARPSANAEAALPINFARPSATVPAPKLLVMPNGTPPPNADKVLASQSLGRTLTALCQSGADIVVFDSPPLLGRVGLTAGAKTFLKHADAVLVVVDLAQTRKDHLLLAQTLLAEAEAPVVGCVVVGPPEEPRDAPRPARNAPSTDTTLDAPSTRSAQWASETPSEQPAATTRGALMGAPGANAMEMTGAPGLAASPEQQTSLRAGRPRARRAPGAR